jgi:hypothetical protein
MEGFMMTRLQSLLCAAALALAASALASTSAPAMMAVDNGVDDVVLGRPACSGFEQIIYIAAEFVQSTKAGNLYQWIEFVGVQEYGPAGSQSGSTCNITLMGQSTDVSFFGTPSSSPAGSTVAQQDAAALQAPIPSLEQVLAFGKPYLPSSVSMSTGGANGTPVMCDAVPVINGGILPFTAPAGWSLYKDSKGNYYTVGVTEPCP